MFSIVTSVVFFAVPARTPLTVPRTTLPLTFPILSTSKCRVRQTVSMSVRTAREEVFAAPTGTAVPEESSTTVPSVARSLKPPL